MCVSLGFVGFSSPLLIEFCSQSKILSKSERMCEDLFAVYLGPQLSRKRDSRRLISCCH